MAIPSRFRASRERVRLVGFKAPETRNAACTAELQLGYRAKGRLLDLVRQGPSDLRLVPCSCPVGTEGQDVGANFGCSLSLAAPSRFWFGRHKAYGARGELIDPLAPAWA